MSGLVESSADARSKTISQNFRCRAWVFYDQISDNVLGSGNVSSVSDDATGTFTINFSIDMTDTNYCVVSGGNKTSGDTLPRTIMHVSGNSKTKSAIQLQVENSNGNNYDESNNSVAIFR